MQGYLEKIYGNLDVDALCEEGKGFESQIHLIISEDQLVAIWQVGTYCHWQKKIEYKTQILPDLWSLSPRICQCMR